MRDCRWTPGELVDNTTYYDAQILYETCRLQKKRCTDVYKGLTCCRVSEGWYRRPGIDCGTHPLRSRELIRHIKLAGVNSEVSFSVLMQYSPGVREDEEQHKSPKKRWEMFQNSQQTQFKDVCYDMEKCDGAVVPHSISCCSQHEGECR